MARLDVAVGGAIACREELGVDGVIAWLPPSIPMETNVAATTSSAVRWLTASPTDTHDWPARACSRPQSLRSPATIAARGQTSQERRSPRVSISKARSIPRARHAAFLAACVLIL